MKTETKQRRANKMLNRTGRMRSTENTEFNTERGAAVIYTKKPFAREKSWQVLFVRGRGGVSGPATTLPR